MFRRERGDAGRGAPQLAVVGDQGQLQRLEGVGSDRGVPRRPQRLPEEKAGQE